MITTPSRRPGEEGMALFIVLILVLVLTVVIFQLSFTTKIEERISQNRQGFLEMSQTLVAVARTGIQVLETDLQYDLGFISDDDAEGEGTVPPLASEVGDGRDGEGDGEQPTERFDSRHEQSDWHGTLPPETLNDVTVDILVLDCESRLDLNHLFEYAQRTEEDETGEIDDEPPVDGPPADPTEPEDDLLPEEEEWEPPTPEQEEDAELVLSRLVQSLIATNEEAGFEYYEVPDPDVVAREIVEWVIALQSEEETRFIRGLDGLKNLPSVSYELFVGPPDPSELEEDDDGGFFDQDDPLGQFADELGEMPGYEQLEDGVREQARPLGLRDVLTSHSTGKVNLNTVRPEVLSALMLSFEDLEEAREIALLIYEFLDSYEVPSEEEQAQAGAEPVDEESQEFNVFKTFNDLGKVDETWTESDEVSEPSVLELLRTDLEPISDFKSQHFTVRLEGERNDRTLSGTMEVVREENDIIVISWRETDR